jgi:WD40 repeat protein
MSADGGKPTTIAGPATQPAWSPDGTKLVYVEGGGGLVIVNADGTGSTPIAAGGLTPAWSPDGSTIVFSLHSNGSYQLWSVPAGGGTETQLTNTLNDDFVPSFSPDGTKIAFQRGNDQGSQSQIVVMNADGTGVTTLTSDGQNFEPKWSPDGGQIAFVSSRAPGLWTMGADGSNQTQMPGVPAVESYDWGASHLNIASTHKTIVYGQSVTISVHLNEFATTDNHTVTLNSEQADGSIKTISSTAVDGHGNASFTLKPSRLATYVATWAGDATHLAGGTSTSVTVHVRAAVTETVSGYYARTGRKHYHLYHYSSSCPSQGRHCPKVTVAVAPNKAGQRVSFRLEVKHSGHWRGVKVRAKLGSRSRFSTALVYGDSRIIGVPIRIRASYNGDALNDAGQSKWVYLKVTR